MDWGLVLIGAAGALVTVYLATTSAIPEFRPLFDIAGAAEERDSLATRIGATTKQIDDIQSEIHDTASMAAGRSANLKTVIETSLAELQQDRARLKSVERRLTTNQVISRTIGFVAYVLLGGVIASLLADKVKIQGLEGDVAQHVGAFVIGATWISYLSVFGLRSNARTADQLAATADTDTAGELDELAAGLPTLIHDQIVDLIPDASEANKQAAADAVTSKTQKKVTEAKKVIAHKHAAKRRVLQSTTRSLL